MNWMALRIAFIALIWIPLPARSETAAKPFYQGKNLTVLINYAAGGPTDIEGRIVASHLAKHVTGNPVVIVQNMPAPAASPESIFLVK